MSEESPRMSWPFPSREDEPWYDRFVDFVRSMDASGFASREDRNLILSGGGTLTWTGSALTWTEAFRVFSPSTGFYTLIAATTIAVADGQVIRAEIVRHPGQNNSVAAEAAAFALNTDNSLVLGLRVGSSFHFRSGQAIQSGTTVDAEDFFAGGGGGGGGFSWKLIPEDTSVTIEENRQMVVQGGITVLGELNLIGELALVD